MLSCVFVTQGYGRRSRTTSESSAHSVGRERSNSAAKQPSPPPPSAPAGKEAKKETKKEAAPRKVNFLRKVPTGGGDLLVNVVIPGPQYLRSPD